MLLHEVREPLAIKSLLHLGEFFLRKGRKLLCSAQMPGTAEGQAIPMRSSLIIKVSIHPSPYRLLSSAQVPRPKPSSSRRRLASCPHLSRPVRRDPRAGPPGSNLRAPAHPHELAPRFLPGRRLPIGRGARRRRASGGGLCSFEAWRGRIERRFYLGWVRVVNSKLAVSSGEDALHRGRKSSGVFRYLSASQYPYAQQTQV